MKKRSVPIPPVSEFEAGNVFTIPAAYIFPLLGSIVDAIQVKLIAHGISEDIAWKLTLALNEAIDNVGEYAFIRRRKKKSSQGDAARVVSTKKQLRHVRYRGKGIFILLYFSASEVSFVVIHDGNSFPEANAILKDREVTAENLLDSHGRGMLFVKTFMTHAYFRHNGRMMIMRRTLASQEKGVAV